MAGEMAGEGPQLPRPLVPPAPGVWHRRKGGHGQRAGTHALQASTPPKAAQGDPLEGAQCR